MELRYIPGSRCHLPSMTDDSLLVSTSSTRFIPVDPLRLPRMEKLALSKSIAMTSCRSAFLQDLLCWCRRGDRYQRTSTPAPSCLAKMSDTFRSALLQEAFPSPRNEHHLRNPSHDGQGIWMLLGSGAQADWNPRSLQRREARINKNLRYFYRAAGSFLTSCFLIRRSSASRLTW